MANVPRTTGNTRYFFEPCDVCKGLGKEPAKVKTATQEVLEWRVCQPCEGKAFRLARYETLVIQYEDDPKKP